MDIIQSVLAKRQALVDQAAKKQQELAEVTDKLVAFDKNLAELAGVPVSELVATKPLAKAKVAAKATVKKAKAKAKKKVAKAKKKVAKAKAKKKVAAKATPKKKVAAKAKKKVAAKAKATTKATTKSASNSVTEASRKNAAEGRRSVATGERPPLKQAMATVMGNKTLNADAVVDALRKKKWLPASSDHRQYISFMLSNNCPETFTRTSKRGWYKVVNKAEAAAPSAKSGNSKKSNAKGKGKSKGKGKKGAQAKGKTNKPATPATPAEPDPKVDANLKEHWGINTDVATDPYKEAEAAPAGN